MPNVSESLVVRLLSELEARDQELREQIGCAKMELCNLQSAGTNPPKVARLESRLKTLEAQKRQLETQMGRLADL